MVLAIIFLASTVAWEGYIALAVPAGSTNSICEPGGCASGSPFSFTVYTDGSSFLVSKSKGGGNAYSETNAVTLFHDIEADAQCTTGCRIIVNQGTYSLSGGGDTCVGGSSNTLCLKSNLFIQGEGEGKTIFQGVSAQNTNILATWAMTNVTLSDFSLDTHGNIGYGIALFNCNNCLVQNVRVFNTVGASKPNTGMAEFGNRNRFINDISEGASSLCYELGNGDRGTEVIGDVGRLCATGIQFDGGNNQVNGQTGDVYNHIIGGEYYSNTGTGVQCTDCQGIVIDGVSAHNNTVLGIALGIQSLTVTKVWGTVSNCLIMFNGNGAGSSAGLQLIGHGSQAIGNSFYDNNNQAINMNGDNLKVVGNSFFDNEASPVQAFAMVVNGGNTVNGTATGNSKGIGVTTWLGGGGTFTSFLSQANFGYAPGSRSVTAGASVYTYTNNDGYNEQLQITNLNGQTAWTCLGQGMINAVNQWSPIIGITKTCTFTWVTTAPTFAVFPQMP